MIEVKAKIKHAHFEGLKKIGEVLACKLGKKEIQCGESEIRIFENQ